MKGKFQRSYRSKNGNSVFVYTVSGTEAELNAYKEAQGTHLREDDETGAPLFFTTRFAGPSADLIITTSGNVIADMSKFDQAASISEQYGGNFGQELASIAARDILGGGSPTGVTQDSPVKENAPDNIDEV